MPEREYFSARNIVTGSTFLLFIFAWNIFPLLAILKDPSLAGQDTGIIGVVFALLALLGIPTIGFLISQIWWLRFKFGLKILEMGGVEKLTTYCSDLKNGKKSKDDRKNAVLVYEYVLHSKFHSNKEMEGLSKYAFRRYDNYVLLSCALCSLILGFIIGFLSRIVLIFSNNLPLTILEFYWWIIILITAITIGIALLFGAESVKAEHKKMHDAVISTLILENKIDKGKLKTIFPDYFKKQSEEKGTANGK